MERRRTASAARTAASGSANLASRLTASCRPCSVTRRGPSRASSARTAARSDVDPPRSGTASGSSRTTRKTSETRSCLSDVRQRLRSSRTDSTEAIAALLVRRPCLGRASGLTTTSLLPVSGASKHGAPGSRLGPKFAPSRAVCGPSTRSSTDHEGRTSPRLASTRAVPPGPRPLAADAKLRRQARSTKARFRARRRCSSTPQSHRQRRWCRPKRGR